VSIRRVGQGRTKNKNFCIFVVAGVYLATGGPSYETPSDIRAFRILGADAVGMSVAQESIVAGHCGIEVFALALITNVTVSDFDSDEMPNHEEVMQVANARSIDIETLVFNFVKRL
jgi:purine-nucleoside phosphorylase